MRFPLLVAAATLTLSGAACSGKGNGPKSPTVSGTTVVLTPSPSPAATGAYIVQRQDDVAAGLSFAGVRGAVDLSDGAIDFSLGMNSGEGASASLALAKEVSADLQVKDIVARPFGDWQGQALRRDGKYVAYRLGAPRNAINPDMSIQGYANSLGPGRIITGSTTVTDANGIEHLPAEPAKVAGHEGYFLGQNSSPTAALSTCVLTWFDGSMYWVITWPCKDTGVLGRDRQELVETAETSLALYDTNKREFVRQ